MRSKLLFAAQILISIGIASRSLCQGQGMTTGPAQVTFESTSQLSVPKSHPRLWWDEARLRHARVWHAKTRPKPSRDDVRDLAFRFLMGAEPHGCDQAIKWLMDFTISSDELSHVASDNARWHGEDAILIYDWC